MKLLHVYEDGNFTAVGSKMKEAANGRALVVVGWGSVIILIVLLIYLVILFIWLLRWVL